MYYGYVDKLNIKIFSEKVIMSVEDCIVLHFFFDPQLNNLMELCVYFLYDFNINKSVGLFKQFKSDGYICFEMRLKDYSYLLHYLAFWTCFNSVFEFYINDPDDNQVNKELIKMREKRYISWSNQERLI